MKTPYFNNLFSQAKCLWKITLGQYPKLNPAEILLLLTLVALSPWLLGMAIRRSAWRTINNAWHQPLSTSNPSFAGPASAVILWG